MSLSIFSTDVVDSGPEEPSSRPPGVTFWPRVGARVIDHLLHLLIGCTAGVAATFFVALVAGFHDESPEALLAPLQESSWLDWVFGTLGYLAFTTVCEGFHGSTLGKRVLGFVVLNEDLAPCSFRQGLIRSFLYLVDSLFFGVVAASNMRGDPDQKRLGDEKAKTIVVRRKDIARVELRSDATFFLVLAAACLVDLAVLTTSLLLKLA